MKTTNIFLKWIRKYMKDIELIKQIVRENGILKKGTKIDGKYVEFGYDGSVLIHDYPKFNDFLVYPNEYKIINT